MPKGPRRPRDLFQLAQVFQEAIEEAPPRPDPDAGKNPAARGTREARRREGRDGSGRHDDDHGTL